ncbi:MAG: DUF1361 domain-containing protein [Chitinophagales bacterium]|nr:DUF1361 domain-containing protein [Chitinophagales bacterium]
MKKIIQTLQQNERLSVVISLSITSALSVFLVFFRVYQTKMPIYVFLIWNLILATIPYVIGLYLFSKRRENFKSFKYIILFFLWLIFLPNAPYILTDLIHLRIREGFPLVLDLIILLFYAWTGLMMCLYSIKDLQQIIQLKYGKKWSMLFTLTIPFICAFGVYIGRFLRYNSWDFVFNFDSVAKDILKHIVFPHQHVEAVTITFLLGSFILVAYYSLELNKKVAE